MPFLLLLSLGCATHRHNTAASYPVNGTWITIKMVMDGKEMPASFYAHQKLLIEDTAYTFTAESVDKGIIRYSGNKMDIYGEEGVNIGKHFTALFKQESGLLSICYNLSGDAYPASFETKSKPYYFLAVFKKA